MTGQGSRRDRDHSKENPEALATFAATARNDGKRPKDRPDRATRETAGIPANPKVKDKAAAKVLKAGAEGNPRTEPLVDRLPDRTKAPES
jgi:hypothetical protein